MENSRLVSEGQVTKYGRAKKRVCRECANAQLEEFCKSVNVILV